MKTLALATLLFMMVGNITRAADPKDLNGDGKINMDDAIAFSARLSAGSMAFDPALDCDKDGKVDLSDALLYGQWVNGLWEDKAKSFPSPIFGVKEDRALFTNYMQKMPARTAMTLAELRTTYPDRTQRMDLNYGKDSIEYLARADSAFAKLTVGGKPMPPKPEFFAQVLRQGMAVYGAGEFMNFQSALDFVHTEDLPLMFTTDAMLNTLYRSYDNILMSLEENKMIPALDTVLIDALRELERSHGNRDYAIAVKDYFQTARNLLAGSMTETDLLKLPHPFGRDIIIDWTQFKPRGHYTRSVRLGYYFRAMMWLSRSDLGLQIGGPAGDTPKAKTTLMKKSSLAMWDAVVNSGSYPAWLNLNEIISFMVGKSDGLSIDGMGLMVNALGSPKIPAFLLNFDEKKFDQVVMAGDYGMQSILSENSADTTPTTRLFGFLPQRFIIDSYTFSEVVNHSDPPSLIPSSLDIAFMLGDNGALQDNPAPNQDILAGQRELYDKLSPAGWQESLYGCWIDFLRKLNGAEDNAKLSPVFRTTTWRKKMRNTQLASWAHLRHNTILYAKQSYTNSITCSHPLAYVEPYPEFFKAVGVYAQRGEALFKKRDAQVANYFTSLIDISKRLEETARTIASGGDPTEAQVSWLRNCVSSDHKGMLGSYGGSSGYKIYNGWYFDLIYDASRTGPVNETDGQEPSYTSIADVHTKPSDERDHRNLVLHAATGYVNLMATIVKLKDCTALFVGPTMTYYDVLTDSISLNRIDDTQWESMLKTKDPKVVAPTWTKAFRF
jgi:hypothetical protein